MSWSRTACAALAFVVQFVLLSGVPGLAQGTSDTSDTTTKKDQDMAFSLSGTWEGQYFYQGNVPPVPFSLQLDAANGRCTGRTTEPNTFGNPSAAYLYGNVSCEPKGLGKGQPFNFHKQYDGTGGVSHGVEYSGIVSAYGDQVTGTWHLPTASGRFTMQRAGGM